MRLWVFHHFNFSLIIQFGGIIQPVPLAMQSLNLIGA
jgi:hypothetical protein